VTSGLLNVRRHGRARVYSTNAHLLRSVPAQWSNYFELSQGENDRPAVS
jgi:hypothetical protein